MEQCWRWYGPDDPVTLDHVKQAGATGVVTALHHIYDGRAWPEADVLERKRVIEAAGLTWSVVESIPVHNSFKIGAPERERYAGYYKDSIRTLAEAGIRIICYNFMPVVDWTRTDLMYRLPTTGYALRFDAIDFAAYDLFVLKRKNAAASYSAAAHRRSRGAAEETEQRRDRADRAQSDRRPAGHGAQLQPRHHARGGGRIRLHRSERAARKPRLVPARDHSGRRGGGGAHVHPSRRSAVLALRPAARRLHGRRRPLHPATRSTVRPTA